MDEEISSKIDWVIPNLMVFYKGALSYNDLQIMPYPDILKLNDYAQRINKERERALK